MFNVNHIRSTFIDYFKRNGHNLVQSSPLVPHNDPSLMFTNSGMVQFKNVFTGDEVKPYKRAVSSQKAVRAGGKHNDLENVGFTARHHTFFEMLGNFSFGDYFKEQAIYYAWECLTKDFALPKEKLYVTIYHEDEEAENYWKKIANLSSDRIIKIKTNDNFWSMGDTGPCGPCSEIFYDHGENVFGGLPGTKNENGDRYIEIWNLVFMQFQQHLNGDRSLLPKQSIDTGMGLERIAAVLQNVHNNYQIDLFENIINHCADIVKTKPVDKALTSYRVIADHLRASAFLIADGVMPSNEGRGYVLRRIMRRAMRHANQLGYQEPLMHKLVNSLVIEMGNAYPELLRAEHFIKEIMLQEELKFKQTLAKGLKLLDEEVNKISTKQLDGDVAFRLYDTYGFPLDLTQDILKSQQMTVDLQGFEVCMQEQKAKAKAAWVGSGEQATDEVWFNLYQKFGATEFFGYSLDSIEAKVLKVIILEDGNSIVITNQTVFYGESGGQTGDIGCLFNNKNEKFTVYNTKKFLGKIHAHYVNSSSIAEGDNVRLEYDQDYRHGLTIHHSATHLLHLILRKNLGEHVTQKGSLVASNYLRFDFSHNKGLSREEIEKTEKQVNLLIQQNFITHTNLMAIDEAIEHGAMALFGEKYEDEVRVVTLGPSLELCGGTHVKQTNDIALFKIISESAIASGIRRIEAICGMHAFEYLNSQDKLVINLANILKIPSKELPDKLSALLKDKKLLEDELAKLKIKLLMTSPLIKQKYIKNILLIEHFIKDVEIDSLREFVEQTRSKNPNSIVVAGSIKDGKTSLVVGVSNNLIEKFNAADIAKQANNIAGGTGGGGRKEIAQAGGYEYSEINAIISYFDRIVNELSFN